MKSAFLQACRGEKSEYVPVWFMRQAGRYLPGYRELRKNYSMLSLIRNPGLAAEIAIEPVLSLGVDAAILFSDILLPFPAMGVRVEFSELGGPVFPEPLRKPEDLQKLQPVNPTKEMAFLGEQISLLSGKLRGVPIIGFAGAPFTLAAYAIEGEYSRGFEITKSFIYRNEKSWHQMMKILTEITTNLLKGQIRSGVNAVQLFDSWIGALSPVDFRNYVLNYLEEIFSETSQVPRIYFGTNTGGLLRDISKLDIEVVGLDWRVELESAFQALGGNRAIQGNLDPACLLGPIEHIESEASNIILAGKSAPGHIFNLGHGIHKSTDPSVAKHLVDFVHKFRS